MIQKTWYPHIDSTICNGCGDCVVACPTDALALSGAVAVVAAPAQCNYCAVCETVCPVGAIDLPYQIVMEAGSWPTS